ncbi:ATP-binding protein [Actinocorallia sp. A-T 12471]|nr:ATP-binding protein [Actinocorallia sp. A-T 12471]MDX6740664.1 ATP-binding protein [Actinocorallia sp. A-T 12471]
MADDAMLCAVELVANACAATPDRHITFRAFFNPAEGTLWVGVWDADPHMPVAQPSEFSLADIDALPQDHEFGGWGLPLVMSLAMDHGVEKTKTGKWVYAVFKGSSHSR